MPTAVVAAASLVLGFAVADLTGVRPLGGLVLVAAVLWCVPRWVRAAGGSVAFGLVALYALGFALSHVIADAVTTWGAVLLVAAAVGAAVFVLVDRDEAAAA